MQLLVRNRVRDFATWRRYFDEGNALGSKYGVSLARMWQASDDPNNVFFLLDIESVEMTEAFMATPESHELGEKSGVLDGEAYYLNAVPTDDQPTGDE